MKQYEILYSDKHTEFVSYGKLSVLDDEDFVEDNSDIPDEVVDELIDRFNGSIVTMSWDEWCDDDTKESIVESVLKSGDFDDFDEDKIYEIFWDWAEGLDEDDFYDEYLDRFNSI